MGRVQAEWIEVLEAMKYSMGGFWDGSPWLRKVNELLKQYEAEGKKMPDPLDPAR